jgi:hypothetical protein
VGNRIFFISLLLCSNLACPQLREKDKKKEVLGRPPHKMSKWKSVKNSRLKSRMVSLNFRSLIHSELLLSSLEGGRRRSSTDSVVLREFAISFGKITCLSFNAKVDDHSFPFFFNPKF